MVATILVLRTAVTVARARAVQWGNRVNAPRSGCSSSPPGTRYGTRTMATDPFQEGQRVWVHGPDGATRPALYVGGADGMSFLGGPPIAYVVLTDTRETAQVQLDRITTRED